MRKVLLATTAALFLTSCSGTTFPTLTLANVQAEAVAIESGINASAVIAEDDTSIPAATVAQIKTAVTAFDAAVTAFDSVSVGGNVFASAESVSTAAEAVVAVLPIQASTKTAIELGLAIVDAFAAGQTVSPVPTTNAAVPAVSPTVGATLAAPAIVPIPIPTAE